MKNVVLAVALTLFGCEGLNDYTRPTATVVRGQLRRTDEQVLAGAKLMIAGERGEQLAVIEVPPDGLFEASLEASGRVSWLATNGSGHAARGDWVLQPGGVNDLGRLWLGPSQSVPWLVTERGLGFEERLTARPSGVGSTVEYAAGQVWFSDELGVFSVDPGTGEQATALREPNTSLVHPEDQPWISGRFEPDCWAILIRVQSISPELVVFDAQRRLELARIPVPNTLLLFDEAARVGARAAFCDANALTLFHFTGGTHLTATRWQKGSSEPTLSSVELAQRRVGALSADVVMLYENTTPRTFWRWNLATEGSISAPADPSFIGYALDQSGSTVWSTFSGALRMADLSNGTYGSVPGVVSASPAARWAAVDGSRYRQVSAPFGSNPRWPYRFTLEAFELRRVNLATREAELIEPHPKLLEKLQSTRIERSFMMAGDDGTLRVFLDELTAIFLFNVQTGASSSWFSTSSERSLMTDGSRLVVVESTEAVDSLDYTRNRTFFSGLEGRELQRRTFLETPRSVPRLVDGKLYYSGRDPLTGLTQVFMLDLDAR